MTDGFKDKLHVEGVIGDGCGGGRIFFIDSSALHVHDPLTKENMQLLAEVNGAKKISKKACIITIECIDEVIKFDLSKMIRIS